MNHGDVFNIAEYCSAYGVKHAVISPGSRNALLMMSFSRHEDITCHVVHDERSAAFTALGISQATGEPVALACTSGTAGVNYAPAIIEAYYTNAPLLVFTADRPPEWIDHLDGQTIRQSGIYGHHVKAEYQLQVSTDQQNDKESFHDSLHSGIQYALEFPKGPVHFNVPVREPFYSSLPLPFDKVTAHLPTHPPSNIPEDLLQLVRTSDRVLIVPGQARPDLDLNKHFSRISQYGNISVVADHISNSQYSTTRHHDLWLPLLDEQAREGLRPDIIISFGLSVISKSLKLLLRTYDDCVHYHFNETAFQPEPLGKVTNRINSSAKALLESLEGNDADYSNQWKKYDTIAGTSIAGFGEYSEFGVMKEIAADIESFEVLHLSNSMPVRYANFFQYSDMVEFNGNRGTSGIDGCTSTAIGHALVDRRSHLLITGDTAFFYDINALWKEQLPSNLKIVILNNSGGGIFRIIPGPSDQPELERFFEAKHSRNAKNVAEDYGLPYFRSEDSKSFEEAWNKLKRTKEMAILEVFIDPSVSPEALKMVKAEIASKL